MSPTQALRRFNRTYTQRIGVLEESYLGTGRPLAVSRLLYEVGATSDDPAVGDLRERLGLDAGYLARLLRRLELDRLVRTEPDPADRRRRIVALTDAGRVARDDLDARSEDLARHLLAPLTRRQCDRLADALGTADLLVRAATVELTRVTGAEPLAREALRRYYAELDRRFPSGFDPGGPLAVDEHATYLLATSDNGPVAYGGLRPLAGSPPGTGAAELKRMWVDEGWRGAGLGSRMLRELEALAARLGHDRVVLDTHGSLVEAIALYEHAGYGRVERYNDNPYAQAYFAKDLG